MRGPDRPGGPNRPGGGQESPRARPWDWRIDPPPPFGPDREPTPDPAGAAGVDATFPEQPAPPAGPSERTAGAPAADPTGDHRIPPTQSRSPWLWLLLGTVAVLLLCCGIGGTTAAVGLARYGPSGPPPPHRAGPAEFDQPAFPDWIALGSGWPGS